MDIRQIIKNFIFHVFLLAIIIILSYLTYPILGKLFIDENTGGDWINLTPVALFLSTYIFLTPLFFEILGSKFKELWILAALFPLIYLMFSDIFSSNLHGPGYLTSLFTSFFVPIIVGFILGFILRKLREKFWDKKPEPEIQTTV